MIENSSKPISKKNLSAATNKLKKVLNPTQWTAEDNDASRIYFNLSTDLQLSDDVTIVVNGVSDDNKIILFNGSIYNSTITGINKGSQKIKCVGFKTEDEKLLIIIGVKNPSEANEVSPIRKILAEVFTTADTKNHCTEIVLLDSFPSIETYVTEFSGEDSSNWEFKIDLGENTPTDINPLFSGTITKIKEAKTADKLADNITFNVSGTGVASSSSTLDFDLNPSSVNLAVNVDTQAILTLVDTAVANKNIPAATTSKVGGFQIYGGTGSPQKSTNQCVVKIDSRNSYNYAYVDANDISGILNIDTYRYSDMSLAPKTSGMLVQYIGPSNEDYTRCFFYQYTPINFNVSTENEKWEFISTSSTTGQAIAVYNVDIDYLIVSGDLKFEMIPENDELWTISNNSIFIVSQNDVELDRLKYSEVKEVFKIKIKDFCLSDPDNTLILNLAVPSGAEEWRQKNVQPMLKIGSPLVFKGTKTWQLLLDIKTAHTAEVGDMYIVSDKSNQEYYWAGSDWEFIGDIFDPYTEGDGISITSSHDISVKYDNSTIKKNGSGNLYVDGLLTDTQADWNETNTSSAAYIKNKPTIPSAQIQSDWNQTNSASLDYIKNKPSIPEALVNADWNASSGVALILNKPNIPDAQIQSDWDLTDSTKPDYIKNKPTIPSAQVNSDWNASSGAAEILNKPSLATVATTGAYSDLSGRPSLAQVATSGLYSDLSGTPSIPTKTSDLTNDSGFVTTNSKYKFTIGSTTRGDSSGTSLGSLTNETAAKNGDLLSLVTTGDKYRWNANSVDSGMIVLYPVGGGTRTVTIPNGWLACNGDSILMMNSESKKVHEISNYDFMEGTKYQVVSNQILLGTAYLDTDLNTLVHDKISSDYTPSGLATTHYIVVYKKSDSTLLFVTGLRMLPWPSSSTHRNDAYLFEITGLSTTKTGCDIDRNDVITEQEYKANVPYYLKYIKVYHQDDPLALRKINISGYGYVTEAYYVADWTMKLPNMNNLSAATKGALQYIIKV